MPWTYDFTPDDVGSKEGVATVTFTDEGDFSVNPFIYSHRIDLDDNDAVSRLKAEIEAARDKNVALGSASVTDSIALATLLALK